MYRALEMKAEEEKGRRYEERPRSISNVKEKGQGRRRKNRNRIIEGWGKRRRKEGEGRR